MMTAKSKFIGFLFILAVSGLGTISTQAQVDDPVSGIPVRIWVQSTSFSLAPDPYIDIGGGYTGTLGTVSIIPGQCYNISANGTPYNNGNDVLCVVPPLGYTVIINGNPGTVAPLASANAIRIIPAADQRPEIAGLATTVSGIKVDWKLSLGSLRGGNSAGFIELVNPGTGSSWSTLFTPAGLSYEANSAEVYVQTSSGVLHRIIANQVAVDLVTLSSTSYEIRCYNPIQMATLGTSPFSGQPFVVYRIEQGSTATTLKFTRETRNITDPYATSVPIARSEVMTLQRSGTWPAFLWTKTDWTASGQTALVSQTTQSGGTSSNRTESIAISAPSGATAVNIGRTYTLLSSGEVVSSETRGTSSPATTSLSYYSNSTTGPGDFGYLQSVVLPGGGWAAYTYYDDSLAISSYAGQVKYIYRPYGNLPATPTQATNVGEVTYYDYAPNPNGFFTWPKLVQKSVNGVLTSKTTTAYSGSTTGVGAGVLNGLPDISGGFTGGGVTFRPETRHDYNSSSSYLTTYTISFYEGCNSFVASKPVSILQPSGLKKVYFYELGIWDGTAFQTTTTPNQLQSSRISTITGAGTTSSGATLWTIPTAGCCAGGDVVYLIDGKSTKEVQIYDERALLVRRETYAWSSSAWHLVSYVNDDYNIAGFLVKETSSNGAVTSSTYDGQLKTSDTDPYGTTTTYTYDASDRIQLVTKVGVGAIPTLATHYSYDAANNLIEQRVGWGQSEQLVTVKTYDDSGRISGETDPGLGTKTTAYNATNRILTQTRADGGTIVTTSNLDGVVASVTGTSVISKFMTYGIDPYGNSFLQTNIGTATSPRWQKTLKDLMGRETQNLHPSFTGLADAVGTKTYDSTTGLLTSSTTAGYAATLYVYDVLGNLSRSGLDVGSGGSLVLASNDRITETNQYYENYSSAWWVRNDQITYPTASSSTPVTMSTKRKRLTGFAAGCIDENQSVDAEGNVADDQTVVNMATVTTTVTTTQTGYTDPQIETRVAGQSVSLVTHDGLTTTKGYDALLRPGSATDSRGNTTTTAYLTNSKLVYTTTDATAAVTATYAYDSMGRVVSQHDASSNYIRTNYDFRDKVLQQWGGGTFPVAYTYDATYGDKVTISTYRGGTGWTGTTWPSSPGTADTTTWTFDGPSGLQTVKTDAASHAVSQTYNIRGQTSTRTLARGVVTTYSYDGDTGELLSQTYSDSTPSVTNTYNRQGKIATVADATGTRTLGYDSSKPWRMNTETFSSYFGSKVMTRLYSSTQVLGRVRGYQLGSSSGSNSDLEATYTFTANGRFNSITAGSSSDANLRTFTYGYLANSTHVSSLTVGDSSFSINRTFETQRDLLTSIEADWGSTSEARYAYTNNALGQRTTVVQSGAIFAEYGGSIFQSFNYDGLGELVSAIGYAGGTITDTSKPLPGRKMEYGYDTIGNRLTDNHTGLSGLANHYTSNALNQYTAKENNTLTVSGTASTSANVAIGGQTALASRQGTFWSQELTVGNTSGPWTGPLSIFTGAAGAGSGGSDLVHLDTRIGQIPAASQSLSYDSDGNLLSDGVWDYLWDAENRLIQMQTTTGAASAGFKNLQLKFVYDYMGRRVQKRVVNVSTSAEVTSRRYIYDGWILVGEYLAPSGTSMSSMTRSYAWGLDIARTLSDAGGVGALLQITDYASGRSYAPGYDGNGNVISLTNLQNGGMAVIYEYNPYGEYFRSIINDYVVSDQNFRFSTKYTDLETGFVYYGHRYYFPALGRFINKDPIQEDGGINLYGFVRNNPVNRWDYLGHSPDPFGGVAMMPMGPIQISAGNQAALASGFNNGMMMAVGLIGLEFGIPYGAVLAASGLTGLTEVIASTIYAGTLVTSASSVIVGASSAVLYSTGNTEASNQLSAFPLTIPTMLGGAITGLTGNQTWRLVGNSIESGTAIGSDLSGLHGATGSAAVAGTVSTVVDTINSGLADSAMSTLDSTLQTFAAAHTDDPNIVNFDTTLDGAQSAQPSLGIGGPTFSVPTSSNSSNGGSATGIILGNGESVPGASADSSMYFFTSPSYAPPSGSEDSSG